VLSPVTVEPVERVVRRLRPLTWGLVPSWSKDRTGGARMINARAETLLEKPAYKKAALTRRCLVPADGWYEWVRDGKARRPYFMTPPDGSPLAFAGLWSMWGDEVLTCTIVTTAALGGLARVHDRMPLILPAERWPAWLAGGGDPAEQLRPQPIPALDELEIREVRPDVGNVRNNGPELIMPPAWADDVEPTLF